MRIALAVALLVACGDDGHTTGDGGPGDGGMDDDAMIDADPNMRGTVTVRVVDKNGFPIGAMYVVFIDTDSTVTERMTDAAGLAVADVYPNASVTAIRNRGMSYAIATVQALNPGDVITLISASPTVSSSEDPFSQRVVPMPSADIAASPNGATKSGSIATFTTVGPHGLNGNDRVIVANVGVAGYNGVWTVASTPTPTTFTANLGSGSLANSGTVATGGATATKAVQFTINYPAFAADTYQVHTRCGSVDVGSVTSAVLDLPITCTGPMQEVEVRAQTSAGITFATKAQSNINVTHGGSVTLTGSWSGVATLAATFTNPTQQVSQITFARFSPHVRGLPFAETTQAAMATTLASLNVSLPSSAGNVTTLTCFNGSAPGCLSTASGATSQRITHHVGGSSSYSLDIGANLLPWVVAVYNAAATTLDITVMGSAPYDIFEANLRYVRGQSIYTWRVFGPIAGSVKFPTLPTTAPGDPTLLTSDIPSSFQAFVGESDAINGYRDAIKNPFESLGHCEASANPMLKSYVGTQNRISQWN
ncbi:MAG TPA: hypothetical protein VIV11_40160 [Kofleriaceae bacterium]